MMISVGRPPEEDSVTFVVDFSAGAISMTQAESLSALTAVQVGRVDHAVAACI
jgi:hypothetical protein